MSHGDRIEAPPVGFQVIAKTENAPVAAMADTERAFYGLQFHPEVEHTQDADQILGELHERYMWVPQHLDDACFHRTCYDANTGTGR